jgi:hypothetical protein
VVVAVSTRLGAGGGVSTGRARATVPVALMPARASHSAAARLLLVRIIIGFLLAGPSPRQR